MMPLFEAKVPLYVFLQAKTLLLRQNEPLCEPKLTHCEAQLPLCEAQLPLCEAQ